MMDKESSYVKNWIQGEDKITFVVRLFDKDLYCLRSLIQGVKDCFGLEMIAEIDLFGNNPKTNHREDMYLKISTTSDMFPSQEMDLLHMECDNIQNWMSGWLDCWERCNGNAGGSQSKV